MQDPVTTAAALALGGAWGGLVAFYSGAALRRWRARGDSGTSGSGGRAAEPARIAVNSQPAGRKRNRRKPE